MKKSILIFFLLFSLQNCFAQEKPNILWISIEDISPTLSMYGDHTAKTPNLDELARQSLVYENAFAPVGVCAPSRSSIITGMQPTAIGTMHMRTGKDVIGWGRREYEKDINRNDIEGKEIVQYSAVIPETIKCFTEYLRAEGYYCTNNPKTDYQFAAPISSWDENGNKAHWKNREGDQPFFAVFNINDTHESKLWKYSDKPLTVDPETVPVPPYFPDTPETRQTIARHYSNIEIMDKKVGEILQEIKDAGLYENTIIFFFSDHGGPLPRQKRAIYDSGLRVPFFIRYPKNKNAGRTDRMISFIDLAPTVLSLAGIQPPDYIQGRAFAGKFEENPREFIFGSSDRFDEITDRIRAIRTKNFLYLYNFYPEKTKYKDISYRKQVPMMEPLLKMKENGELDSIAMQWFQTKEVEELYDVSKDPHNINNIADNRAYTSELNKMRRLMRNYLSKHPDLGQIPESRLISLMWPDKNQPETQKPEIIFNNNSVRIESKTEGASIVYMVTDEKNIPTGYDADWKLYTNPITAKPGQYILSKAERIGYKTSELSVYKVPIK